MEFSELIKTATVEDVLLSRPGLPAVRGTLCITSHHLLLSSCPRGDLELWLLIRNVDAVEKRWGCPQRCPCHPCSPLSALSPLPELHDPPRSPRGHPTGTPLPARPCSSSSSSSRPPQRALTSCRPQSAEFGLVPAPPDWRLPAGHQVWLF